MYHESVMWPAYWLPPVVWMGIIMLASTDFASADHTGRVLIPFFQWLIPWATVDQARALHAVTRKLGHLTEYAILAFLWYRAFVRGRSLTPRRSAWFALTVSLVWACLDEAHQATTLTRTASTGDVAIDGVGAVAALTLARRRGSGR